MLENGQRKRNKMPKSFIHADNSSVPESSINSIDHNDYCAVPRVPSGYPSTSAEVLDRRQAFRRIYSTKRSAQATTTKDRLAIKPSSSTLLPLRLLEKRSVCAPALLDNGRTSKREEIDDLREELYAVKRNYAIIQKENVTLKTRLKRTSNELVKKDRQLQNLLFMQSKGYAPDDQRGNMLLLKKKVAMLESLLKEKSDEISQLRADREAVKISDYREQIAALQMECNRLKRCLSYATPPPSKLRADLYSSSKKQESGRTRKLKKAVSLLEEENSRLRSKLQIFTDDAVRCCSDELATLEREELITLVIRLKNELKKKNDIGSSKISERKARSAQKSGAVTHKLRKTKEPMGIKSEVTQPKVEEQNELKAEIMKIHSDDEKRGRVGSAVRADVTGPVEEVEANADVWESDEGSTSELNEAGSTSAAKSEDIDQRSKNSFSDKGSGEAQDISRNAEQEQPESEIQREHAARTIQRNWKNYKSCKEEVGAAAATEDIRLLTKNQHEIETIPYVAANSKSTLEGLEATGGSGSEIQEWSEEEEMSTGAQKQLKGVVSTAEADRADDGRESRQSQEMQVNGDEMEANEDESFDSYSLMEGNVGLRRRQHVNGKGSVDIVLKSVSSDDQVQVYPSVVFRTILRATSAHLKRLELLAAKSNSNSSS